MVDVQAMQDSFLLNWGEMSLMQEEAEWKVIPGIFFKRVWGMTAFHSNIKLKEIKGMGLIKSRVWKGVLQVWIDHNGVKCGNSDVYLSDSIFNNNMIRFRGETLFIKIFIDMNVACVKDLYEDQSIILRLTRLKEIYGSYNSVECDYYAVINTLANIQVQFTNDNPRREIFHNLSRKEIYNKINSEGRIEHVTNFGKGKAVTWRGKIGKYLLIAQGKED